jgi:hypothetical protein
MSWLPRFLIATLLSAGIAIALSFLPQLENGWSSPAFHAVKAQPVSETNIVDVISKMQLHERIRKVEVTHAIISVDLIAAPGSGRGDIVRDVYEIPKTLFSLSTNINQVLVRVMDNSNMGGGNPTVLLATDARREKWLPSETVLGKQSVEEIEQYLQSHFRMTYTPIWKDRFDVKS